MKNGGSFVRLMALVMVAGTACTSAAFGAPPSDALVQERATKFAEETKIIKAANREEMETVRKAKSAAAMEGFTIEEMSATQIMMYDKARVFSFGGDAMREPVRMRLETLSNEATTEGVEAALLAIKYTSRYNPEQENADGVKATQLASYMRLLDHPKLGEVLAAGTMPDFYVCFSRAMPELFEGSQVLSKVAAVLPSSGNMEAAARARSLMSTLVEVKGSSEDKLAINAKLVRICESAIAASGASSDARMVEAANDSIAFLNGAFAKGMLIDGPMPPMNITWSSDPSLSSVDAFKGKVVVLDFWATWCGPCRTAFPNIAKLAKYYEGYPVVIVGVTSIQGSHTDPKAATKEEQRIDTKDDAAKEMALMPSFIKNWEMTWPVIFTKESCFNPDFGINGIPHVAIIDPEGKVRFNGLSPHGDLTPKTDKINDLLKKAGLPVPSPYVDQTVEEPKKTSDKGPALVPAAEMVPTPEKKGG